VSEEQPNHVTFYFDTTHGKLIPKLLRSVDLDVKNYRHLGLSSDADDREWIGLCGQQQWVIISGDKNISRVPEERQAVINARCKVFMFDDSDVTRTEDWAASVLVARKHILELVLRTNGPYFAIIKPCSLHGHIKSPQFIGSGGWKPAEEWPQTINPPSERPRRIRLQRPRQQKIEFPEHVSIQLYRYSSYHCELCERMFNSKPSRTAVHT